MWYEKDPSIINASLIEDLNSEIVFEHQYLEPIKPSNRMFCRDFLIEKKRSYEISGIAFHSYKNDLFTTYNNFGIDYYNGSYLDLKFEPWNEYDSNAIAIYMGTKLGYIRRYDTEEVGNIMKYSKGYIAEFNNLGCPGLEHADIHFLQEFKDKFTLPYQTDLVLTSPCSSSRYKNFIKGNIGHVVSFDYDFENGMLALLTDMNSIIGYIVDSFIEKQYLKTQMIGFIEDAKYSVKQKTLRIKLRLLMDKSVVNKNYLKSFEALKRFFGTLNDAGTYTISLTDLVKVVPRKSRSISAYEPLVKYLKEYHAINLKIE
jgi:hypothetical protein